MMGQGQRGGVRLGAEAGGMWARESGQPRVPLESGEDKETILPRSPRRNTALSTLFRLSEL